MDLTGRVVLVTGGSRGVGRAISERLAARGAAVAVNYRRDEAAAEETVAAIRASGGSAVARRAAVDDPRAVTEMLDAIRADLGVIDVVISNAGTASTGRSIADTETEEYVRLMNVHTLGPLALIRSLLPPMRQRPRADIVFISSVITDDAPVNSAPYSMAKAALEMAARTLAREERSHGIRVNVVAPGLVATDMGERLVRAVDGGALHDLDPSYPFGRVCRPEDVAGVVAFLVSDDSDYVTGQRIAVDGGGPDRAVV